MTFTQAPLQVENRAVFDQLKQGIERALAPEAAEDFLRQLKRNGLQARDFAGALKRDLLHAPAVLYEQLGPGDQGQIRELYLLQIEAVAPELRERFKRVYSYY